MAKLLQLRCLMKKNILGKFWRNKFCQHMTKKQKERKICLYRKKVNRKNHIEMTNLIQSFHSGNTSHIKQQENTNFCPVLLPFMKTYTSSNHRFTPVSIVRLLLVSLQVKKVNIRLQFLFQFYLQKIEMRLSFKELEKIQI